MKPGALAGTIRLVENAAGELRSGERVAVQVLKLLAEGKWAVGLKGRVYPAVSTVPLKAGDRLWAVVQGSGRRIVLRLGDEAAGAQPGRSQPAESFAQALTRAFVREGLSPDELRRGALERPDQGFREP